MLKPSKDSELNVPTKQALVVCVHKNVLNKYLEI